MRLEVGDIIQSIHTGNKYTVEYVSEDGYTFVLAPNPVVRHTSSSYSMSDYFRSFKVVRE